MTSVSFGVEAGLGDHVRTRLHHGGEEKHFKNLSKSLT